MDIGTSLLTARFGLEGILTYCELDCKGFFWFFVVFRRFRGEARDFGGRGDWLRSVGFWGRRTLRGGKIPLAEASPTLGRIVLVRLGGRLRLFSDVLAAWRGRALG